MTACFADTFFIPAMSGPRDITIALAGDHHFDQAGFIALLK